MPADNAGVFHVRNNAFAAGLFWQTAADEETAIGDIKLTAGTRGTEGHLYCLRAGPRPQWALGVNDANHLPGQIAAAGVVADFMLQHAIDSWAAAFVMPNGFCWFTSGRDGLIDPEGDHRLPHPGALADKVDRALRDARRQLLILPKDWTWKAPKDSYDNVAHYLFHRLPLPTNPATLVDITLGSTFSLSRLRSLAGVAVRYLPWTFSRHLELPGGVD